MKGIYLYFLDPELFFDSLRDVPWQPIFAKICEMTFIGGTENAGVENAIRAKLQGYKMQEWKIQE